MFKRVAHVQFWLRVAVAVLFVMGVSGIWYSGIQSYLTIGQLQTNAAWLHEQVAQHYWQTALIYCALYIGLVVCSLPGSAFMNVVGGFLFGIFPTLILSNIAATTGATLFFLSIRYVLGGSVQKRYEHKLVHFNRMVEEKGWFYLLLIRFIPLVPFFMINILAGLTNIRVSTFIWTTSVGIIPAALIFSYAGLQLATITTFADIFSVPILILVAVMLGLTLIPMIVNKYRKIF